MSSPERYDPQITPRERLEEWTWLESYGKTTAARPPVFNDANRSCAEAAQHTSGIEQLHDPILEDQPTFAYDNTRRLYNHLRSRSSSESSGYGPEGPEISEPDLHVASFYLPLAPQPGLGEAQHRRTASFESNMSYQMRQYLATTDSQDTFYATEHVEPGNHFLSQTTAVQPSSSKKVNKNSWRSKPSYITDSSGDASFVSWAIDPVTGNGAWMDEDGNNYGSGTYPMTLSGATGSLDEFTN